MVHNTSIESATFGMESAEIDQYLESKILNENSGAVSINEHGIFNIKGRSLPKVFS